MASSSGYAVTISATDKFSATLAKFNRQVQEVTAPVRALGKAASDLGDTTGINRLGTGFQNLQRHTLRVTETLSRLAPALAAVTAVGTAAGIGRLAGMWGDAGLKLEQLSARLGMAPSKLANFQDAARLAGSSSEAMTGGLQGLQETLQDSVGGRNTEAVLLFNKLGVSFRDAEGNARRVTDVMPELADKIAGIRNPQIQAMVATRLFGGAAVDLLPLLRRGSAGLREYQEEARKYGGWTDKGAESAGRFSIAQTRLGLAMEGLGIKIAERTLPYLTPLLDRVSAWVAKDGDEFAKQIGDIAKGISEWLTGDGVTKFIKQLDDFGTKVDSIVKKIEAWQTVGEGLLDFMTGRWSRFFGGGGVEHNGGWFDRRVQGGMSGGPAGIPNGMRRPGPTFGPQGRPSGVEANPSPEDAAYKPVLDLLGKAEGTDRGRGYNETLGYGKWTGGNQNITGMTLDQVDKLQQDMLNRQHAMGIGNSASSAVGRYQFTQTTLREMREKYGLSGDAILNEQMQDHLAVLRIKMGGGLSQRTLAGGWASVPDPYTGQSHYGQGVGVSEREVQDAIRRVQTYKPGLPVPPIPPAGTTDARPGRARHCCGTSRPRRPKRGGSDTSRRHEHAHGPEHAHEHKRRWGEGRQGAGGAAGIAGGGTVGSARGPQGPQLVAVSACGGVNPLKNGGCCWVRTNDPLIKSQLLYHLS